MQGALQPLLTVLVIALVFAPLERLLPARRPPGFRWRRYATDFLHLTLGGLLIRLGTTALLAVALGPIGHRAFAAGLPLALQVLMILLVCDLMFWLAHRLFHAVPGLWRFHRIHHSSPHLDWLAAYRVHPVDQIVNATIIALPALALGFSPAALAIYGVAYQWHAILLHSNVRVSLGPLERLVTTPRFHHWHHADLAEAHDRNFGGQLTIWDRLFGTAYAPPQPCPDRYGIDDPPREGFVDHLVAPFHPRTARWPN